jgi:hypothetical protein
MNSTFTKPSDQSNRIQVESNIIYCLWTCGRAWAGCVAPFEVRTSLVGEGAEIKFRLMNDSGKTLEKKSDKIFGNRYRGTIEIPSKVKLDDMLYIEVELPKHKLDIESNQIPAGPAIQVQSMQWGQQEVKRGDTVKMQAKFVDLPDKTEAEVTVYEYSDQNYHDPIVTIPTEINSDQMEILWEFQYQNDVAQIPTMSELQPYNKSYQQPQYFFVIEIDGNKIGVKQESGLLKFKDSVDFVLKDSDGNVLPDIDCVITGPDNKEVKVKTDKNGAIAAKDIPPGSLQVRPDKPKTK